MKENKYYEWPFWDHGDATYEFRSLCKLNWTFTVKGKIFCFQSDQVTATGNNPVMIRLETL